jgi:hypothetical protein
MKRYFPNTICKGVSGLVDSVSKVPDLYSSESDRIEIAGTKKSKTHGAN